MAKMIMWFEEITKDDVAVAGGKGANLGEMTRAGFPVPPGFVITADVYFKFLEATGIKEKIAEILWGLNVEDTEALLRASQQIQELIKAQEVPPEIANEILAAYDALAAKLGEAPLVAVRSSATAEDLKEASFAGQQATFLNVTREGLIEAVKGCWASLFTARAIYYREQQGFDHMSVGIAVVVQKMVQSEVSGVMFTRDPATGEDKVIIEAVFGLGEGIVSGRYTPDHYEVDPKTWKIIAKEIARQEKMLVFVPGKGNIEVDVPEEFREVQKVPDDVIIEIAKMGKRLEEHYNWPQDVEWAMEKGKVYVVQTRAVTTIPSAAETKAEEKAATAEISKALKPILRGLGASPGIAAGVVKIVHSLDDLPKVKEGDVLVTTMTNPDMVPAMKRAAAIVTDQGGMTSHAAIVSRELGIPAVVGTKEATKKLKEGMVVTVDGRRGLVFEGDVTALLKGAAEKKEAKTAAAINWPVFATKLMVNLSAPEEAEKIAALPVDGVGLLRAEFIVGQIGIHPKEAIATGKAEEFVEKLAEAVARIAGAFWPRPVIYRSFDFKTNEYRNLKGGEKYEPHEENPMIGYRGAARAIKDPEVFALELEMIKKVRREYGYDNLWLMMPFIRTPEEVKKIREVLEREGLLKERNFKFLIMAEVPSVAIMPEEFLKYCDGISIGSNDLTQLVLGVDRDNAMIADIFYELNPAVLKAIENLITTARKMGKYSSICGQAPSVYPEMVEKLVQLGIEAISVNPDAIERTAWLIARAERKLMLEAGRKA